MKIKSRKFRRKRWTIILLIMAFFIFIIFISSYHHTHRLRRIRELKRNRSLLKKQRSALISLSSLVEDEEQVPKKREDEVVILLWTKYFGGDLREDRSWILTNISYPTCFEKCRVVANSEDLAISDAVIFHSRDIRKDELPFIHPRDQLWVYLQQESPSYTNEDLTEFANVFNWTMTYRRDSDVYHPYFKTLPRNFSETSAPDKNELYTDKLVQSKTKLVAWIVSNCDTNAKRENYVDQLEAHIPIDIYGRCGVYSCQRSGEGCLPEIAQQYKFYLSFENSLCSDYITEKFSNALKYNIVPIVYGGGDYSSVAPPGSYINALDFATPKALADYLLLLNKNPKLYLKYFKWKTKFQVKVGDGWCSLCRKVAEHKRNPSTKVYEDLSQWWRYKSSSSTKNIMISDSTTTKLVPMCHDASNDLLDRWNLLGIVKGLKFVKRWFHREILG